MRRRVRPICLPKVKRADGSPSRASSSGWISTVSRPRSMSCLATARVKRPARSAAACSPTIQAPVSRATSGRPVAMRLAISRSESAGLERRVSCGREQRARGHDRHLVVAFGLGDEGRGADGDLRVAGPVVRELPALDRELALLQLHLPARAHVEAAERRRLVHAAAQAQRALRLELGQVVADQERVLGGDVDVEADGLQEARSLRAPSPAGRRGRAAPPPGRCRSRTGCARPARPRPAGGRRCAR